MEASLESPRGSAVDTRNIPTAYLLTRFLVTMVDRLQDSGLSTVHARYSWVG